MQGTEHGFAARLRRFAVHLGVDVTVEPDLARLIDGDAPEPELLRAAAPVLGLHAADLFAIADVTLPDDLAPVDASAGHGVASLALDFVELPQEARAELLRLVSTLPHEPPAAPPDHPDWVRTDHPGAVIWRMLAARRLARPQTDHIHHVAKTMRP